MKKKPPRKAFLTSGDAEGKTELEAFDSALRVAKIGNYNLTQVTSILPANCELTSLPNLKEGTVLPTAMAKITSSNRGETVTAALSVAMSQNSYGVISEYSGKKNEERTKEKSEKAALRMLKERELRLKKTETVVASHKVEEAGAAIAAVVFSY